MEITPMGRVVVAARMENWADVKARDRGQLAPENVRSLSITNALVDAWATHLSLPSRLIQHLGLARTRTRQAKTSAGVVSFDMYEPIHLIVQDRDCFAEVAEVPDNCPVLIGQLPLEALDFLIDPAGRKLVGNPDHSGEHMFEMY